MELNGIGRFNLLLVLSKSFFLLSHMVMHIGVSTLATTVVALELGEEHWSVLLPFLVVFPVAISLVVFVLAEWDSRYLDKCQ